ncbi:BRICHOS-like domain-containing protein out at first [Haematobia irritans]|uniref:BRICHOS-like domain-containing protein out at first n=1 Tax=Haematobia irritans TaxID=7368 RepID=UPI003F4FF310
MPLIIKFKCSPHDEDAAQNATTTFSTSTKITIPPLKEHQYKNSITINSQCYDHCGCSPCCCRHQPHYNHTTKPTTKKDYHIWRRCSSLFLLFLSKSASLAGKNILVSRKNNRHHLRVGDGGDRLASVNISLFLLLNLLLQTCCGQLLINVQNQGGEVIQESITSNVSEDLITLEFQKTDGTLITQIIDFRNEVRILKALVLGEEERGQNLYQVMCFVTKFNKGDFISSDAMAKLRQKNPSTIRTPEDDKGKDTFTMTSWVHLNRSQPISRHLMTVCGEAVDATYVRDVDLKAWSELPGSSISSLEAATEKFPDTLSSRCNEVSSLWAPCICTLETCIGWYPCGLKYCKGKTLGDSSAAAAAASNYRCGIKTCRKCSLFSYYVRQKQQCLWDE